MIKIKNVKKMKSLHPKSYMSIILKNISKCNGFLLFNSLSKLQTKPLPSIRHICAVAGEGELNRRGDLGTEADVFCLLENDWE